MQFSLLRLVSGDRPGRRSAWYSRDEIVLPKAGVRRGCHSEINSSTPRMAKSTGSEFKHGYSVKTVCNPSEGDARFGTNFLSASTSDSITPEIKVRRSPVDARTPAPPSVRADIVWDRGETSQAVDGAHQAAYSGGVVLLTLGLTKGRHGLLCPLGEYPSSLLERHGPTHCMQLPRRRTHR